MEAEELDTHRGSFISSQANIAGSSAYLTPLKEFFPDKIACKMHKTNTQLTWLLQPNKKEAHMWVKSLTFLSNPIKCLSWSYVEDIHRMMLIVQFFLNACRAYNTHTVNILVLLGYKGQGFGLASCKANFFCNSKFVLHDSISIIIASILKIDKFIIVLWL